MPTLHKIVRHQLERLARDVLTCERALQLDSSDESDLDRLATQMTAGGLFAQAEAARGLLVEKHPTSADAHFKLGDVLQREGKFTDAIAEFHAAVQLDAQSPRFHVAVADSLADAGQRDAALRQYNLALELDPNSHPAQMGRQKMVEAGAK